tara:strand:+ start:193 stop:462 length:270 start_codon:yes stop_codon:yes gene_type:complete
LNQEEKDAPAIEEIPLSSHVQRALTLRGNGSTWKVATKSVGMDYRTVRKYVRDHPDANDFPERQTQDAFDKNHSKLIAAAPTAAQRLIG